MYQLCIIFLINAYREHYEDKGQDIIQMLHSKFK